MNKRALIGLTVVPIALVSAMIWARRRAWRNVEDDFRKDFIGRPNPGKDVWVKYDESYFKSVYLGSIKFAEFKVWMSQIRLQPQRTIVLGESIYYSLYYKDADGNLRVVFLDSVGQQGRFVFAQNPKDAKWRRYQLTPESCRAIKEKIWSQFGPKLRELHIPPPR